MLIKSKSIKKVVSSQGEWVGKLNNNELKEITSRGLKYKPLEFGKFLVVDSIDNLF